MWPNVDTIYDKETCDCVFRSIKVKLVEKMMQYLS